MAHGLTNNTDAVKLQWGRGEERTQASGEESEVGEDSGGVDGEGLGVLTGFHGEALSPSSRAVTSRSSAIHSSFIVGKSGSRGPGLQKGTNEKLPRGL